jgi:hypothetical protein
MILAFLVMVLLLLAVYFLLNALKANEPFRSLTLAVVVIVGLLYVLGYRL